MALEAAAAGVAMPALPSASASTTTGRIIGLSGFNLAGQDINQFAVRAGIGAEFDMGAATSFISLNGALQGNEATAWVKSGIKFAF